MSESPDLTPYVDLRIFDRDFQDIFEVALQDLQTKMPEWIPREDNTETMLMESMALEVGESIFAINRLPGAIMVALMRLYGIVRDEGAPPTSTATFTAVDTFGYTIPAGTRVALGLNDGENSLVFTTDYEVTIPNGQSSITAPITGTTNTDSANGVATNTVLDLLDAINAIDSVKTASIIGNGADQENDQSWLSRGVQRLNRLVETLAVPAHFTARALEEPEVFRAYTIDNFNIALGTGVPGDHPGHVSVLVYGDGLVVPTIVKTNLQASMEDQALANLSVHVADAPTSTVNVTVTAYAFPNWDKVAVDAAVTQALTDYLSPANWEWSATLYRNELIALISNVPGVDRTNTPSVPAADTTALGTIPTLAKPGTINVTVL